MNAPTLRRLLRIIALLALVAAALLAQPSLKPISLSGLQEALKIGGLATAELVQIVKERGVDFELTPDREATLKSAGAQPALIEAVRANHRRRAAVPVEATAAPPPSPRPAAASRPVPKSVRDVHRIYVEEMPGDLDQFIKQEIARQMPERLVVALKKSDADAVMSGEGAQHKDTGSKVTGGYLGMKDTAFGAVTITDVQGSIQLWTSEAGDKSPFLGVVKRGGPRRVAERLVGNLKKALSERR